MENSILLLVRTMGIVVGSWLVFQIILTGWGALVRRAAGLQLTTGADWLTAFWVGLSVVIVLLQVWHLFLPANLLAFGVFGAVGGMGFVLHARDLSSVLRRAAARWVLVALAAILTLIFANAAIGPVAFNDYGFYQQQAVMWNRDYAIVPGLGNVHGRFGFNNAWLLFVAMTDTAPYAGIARHIAGGLLIVNVVWLGVHSLGRLFDNERNIAPDTVFGVMLVPIGLWLAGTAFISSPLTDLPGVGLGLIVGWLLWQQLHRTNQGLPTAYHFIAIVLIVVAGITSKLSFGLLGSLSIALSYWLYRRDQDHKPAVVIYSAVYAAAALILWLGRGVMLSGYPLYPVETVSFAVDWRVSCDVARRDALLIYAFARTAITPAGQLIENGEWLGQWFLWALRDNFGFAAPMALALIFFPGWLIGSRRRMSTALLLIPPLASIVFWFFTAPDPRFAYAALWILAISLLILSMSPFMRRNPGFVRVFVLLLVGGLSLWQLTQVTFYAPHPLNGFYPDETTDYTRQTTNSGLVLHIPEPSYQLSIPDSGLHCFATQLPCTPYFSPTLERRTPATFQSGFRDTGSLRCAETNGAPSLLR